MKTTQPLTAAAILAKVRARRISNAPYSEGGRDLSGIDLALVWASTQGHIAAVAELMQKTDPKNNSSLALCEAAANNHIDIVHLLLPVSDPKAEWSTPIYRAAQAGHVDVVHLLVGVSGPPEDLSFALAKAAENGHVAVVRVLAKHIAKAAAEVGDSDAVGVKALIAAVDRNDAEVARLVMPIAISKGVVGYGAAMLRAAKLGHLELIKLMLEHVAANKEVSMESQIYLGLFSAAQNGQMEVLEYLAPKYNDLQDMVERSGGSFTTPALSRIQSMIDERAIRIIPLAAPSSETAPSQKTKRTHP